MDSLGSLGEAEKVIGGGLGLVVVWGIRSGWKAYKEWRKEQREGRSAEDELEAKRAGRLNQGFAALDASRDREIQRQSEARDADQRRHDAERQVWMADLARERALRIAAEENRDEGWDKGRAMEIKAHQYRHLMTGLLQSVYAAGRFGGPMPEALQRVYEAGRDNLPIPAEITPQPVPALQDVPRQPPPA